MSEEESDDDVPLPISASGTDGLEIVIITLRCRKHRIRLKEIKEKFDGALFIQKDKRGDVYEFVGTTEECLRVYAHVYGIELIMLPQEIYLWYMLWQFFLEKRYKITST